MLEQNASNFYSQLAGSYHLVFKDWEASVRWQGKVLDSIIKREEKIPTKSILDCSCGIGTQTIGLALFGYNVQGTDISPAAVERAGKEACKLGLSIPFSVADFLKLGSQVEGTFDTIISCDNSLPHLLTEKDISKASKQIISKLKPNGLFIASIRDYDNLLKTKPKSTPPVLTEDSAGKSITFQIWKWLNNEPCYEAHLFILKENDGKWETEEHTVKYRALLRSELTEALEKAGFTDVRWQMPEESGYYQPIVIARKA